VFHGGWFPLVVGAIFFTILTTWHRGRSELARVMREGRVTVRKFINRMIDERPDRVPGTAVFLTQSLETAPTALLRNVEHNGVLHERVVLLKLETVRVPHVANAHRLRMEQLRLGFLALTARYGYQDEPDVVAVIRLAAAQGADLDPDRVSYFVDHVSILPTGRTRLAGWRKRLFALLYQNSVPAARYYGIPPDQVFEVGAYVQL
jgi:KUP system potassium uptake protein